MRNFLLLSIFSTFIFAQEFQFFRISELDGAFSLQAYVVADKFGDTKAVSNALNLNQNELVIAKIRVVNGKQEHYLQAYNGTQKTLEISPYGKIASEILDQFRLIF